MSPIKTGRLRTSITHQIKRTAINESIAKVGTNVKYARRMEYGFDNKTDKLGRKYKQRARPYLKPALKRNFAKIESMISKAIKGAWQ